MGYFPKEILSKKWLERTRYGWYLFLKKKSINRSESRSNLDGLFPCLISAFTASPSLDPYTNKIYEQNYSLKLTENAEPRVVCDISRFADALLTRAFFVAVAGCAVRCGATFD